MIPQINRQEAANFAQVWNHNGIAVVLDNIAIDFATDFANVVLKSFILQCQLQAQQAILAQQQAAQNVATNPTPNKLIVEG